MAVSPFVKVGVALTSAAMIAAIPAIAPPLTPKDEQIVAGAGAQLAEAKLAASREDLINIFFNVDPGDWPGFDDENPSNGGITGVIYRLLWDATADDATAQEYVEAYFNVGIDGVIEKLLVDTAPPQAVPYIQAFFGDGPLSTDDPGTTGIQGVIYQALHDAAAGNPAAQDLITTFFVDGFVGLSQVALTALFPGLEDQINQFYEGGITEVVGEALVDAAPADLDPYIQRYFSLAPYNTSNTEPGETGAFGVLLQFLNQVGPAETDELFDAYFADGAAALTQTIITNNLPDGPAKDLVDEFFNTGVDGVIRYILAGPQPPPSPPALMMAFDARAGAPEGAVDELDEPTGDDLDLVDANLDSKTSASPLGNPLRFPKLQLPKLDLPPAPKPTDLPELPKLPEPPVSPLAEVTPSVDGAITPPAPVKLPKKFTINKDKATGTEALESGEVEGSEDEILLEGNGAPKPLNFHNFKKIADSVGNFLKPKKPETAAPAADEQEKKDAPEGDDK